LIALNGLFWFHPNDECLDLNHWNENNGVVINIINNFLVWFDEYHSINKYLNQQMIVGA